MKAVPEKKRREQILREAWIGDAVLCLYARERILREDGCLDGEKYVRMTSNRFLACIGDASEVEAGIGRVFERDGLKAAYLYIEQQLIPLFERQEQNYLKKHGSSCRCDAPQARGAGARALTLSCE